MVREKVKYWYAIQVGDKFLPAPEHRGAGLTVDIEMAEFFDTRLHAEQRVKSLCIPYAHVAAVRVSTKYETEILYNKEFVMLMENGKKVI